MADPCGDRQLVAANWRLASPVAPVTAERERERERGRGQPQCQVSPGHGTQAGTLGPVSQREQPETEREAWEDLARGSPGERSERE